MAELLTKEDRLTAEVQHLALDLYALRPEVKSSAPRFADGLQRQRAELLDTLTTKMLAVGPMSNKQGGFFLALGERLFQHVETAPARSEVYDMAGQGPESWQWLSGLARALPCTKEAFHLASKQAAYLLSARALARPAAPVAPQQPVSMAGGRYFAADVWVSTEMVQAFRRELSDLGGVIEREWEHVTARGEAWTDVRYFTIGVSTGSDLFALGKFMVLRHYAEKAEGGQPA